MSCTPFETMSAYVDDALPELEKAAVRSHVDSCPECRSQLAELLSLKDAVRGLAPAAEASEEFKERLTTEFRKRRRRRSAGLAFAGGLVLAAAAIVVALPIIRERRVMAALIGDHVGITVTREEPFHVTSGDAATLERWFTGKIDFPLHIPQIPNAKLVGARLCDIVGKEIPLASYELGTRRVYVRGAGARVHRLSPRRVRSRIPPRLGLSGRRGGAHPDCRPRPLDCPMMQGGYSCFGPLDTL
jgi:anti-sigma factor RsiW